MNFTYLSPPIDEESGRSAGEEQSLVRGITALSFDKNRLQIYPNPSNQNFKVIYNSSEKLEFNYVIRDILGKEIISGFISPNIETEIDGKHFSNGIYFVTLMQGNRIIEKKKQVIIK